MRRIAVTALILAATAAQSMADGMMFWQWQEEIPPKIPYQRAFILFDKGTETLILQSRYEIPKRDGNSTLGWVVPVPAVPEVASLPADRAQSLFMYLSEYSEPKVTRIEPIFSAVLFFAVPGLSLLTLLLCLLSFVLTLPQRFKENRGRLARYSMWGLLIGFPMLILGRFTLARGSLGVDVIAEQHVGIYDVSIVRSENTEGLIGWLNKNNFKFGDRDRAAFDSYISKGWCFVVAIINPSTGEKERRIVSEGLAAPLILRFPHTNPTYPVALTGTGGFETEILIYLASSTKMTANDRLTLRFAGETDKWLSRELLSADFDPEGFFDPKKMNFPYLCKFRDRLTPDRMREDIIFSEAKDDKPYREHIVIWGAPQSGIPEQLRQQLATSPSPQPR